MDATSELVQMNLKSAATQQKRWYDRNTRERAFQAGDRVLVLLPTSTSKLMAQWHGPGEVVKTVGKIDYLVRTPGQRKPEHLFHVNVLQRWHDRTPSVLLAQAVPIPSEPEEVPVWNEADEEQIRMGKHLSAEQAAELGSLLGEFEGVFQVLPGHTTLTEHRIITEDAHLVRLAPYRIPHAYRDDVKRELEEMLECGIIEPSTSGWSSPLVTVKKKDGSLRLCVDYRRLNWVSKMDAYPILRVDDLTDKVSEAPFITTLDLTKGYWQVPVAVQDREKAAFSTPYGLFQFSRMPFGLQGAPATFQRMIDKILNQMGDFASAYIDDVIVYSRTWQEHLNHMKAVLSKIQQSGLTLKRKKCRFAMLECVYVGHLVGSGRVCPEDIKVEAIRNFEQPTTKTRYIPSWG